MEPDFRRAMGWLHTWSGVVLGCILFAIFWMGTLSVFDIEIDQWMKPATRLPPAAQALPLESFRPSLNEAIAARAPFWNVELPNDRQSVASVHYRSKSGAVSHDIDPVSGHVLPDTGTLGASGFIFPFHYTLHIKLMNLGEWLVGLASMAMLVLCVSGVIIHRKIFAEFFTFRPRKQSRRLLLDLHNLSGVLGLPFHIILTFSGLTILGATFFPTGIKTLYPSPRGYFYEANSLSFLNTKPGQPGAPVVSLDETFKQANALWGGDRPETVLVFNPGKTTGRIAFFRSTEQQVVMNRDVVAFSSTTGELLSHPPAPRPIIRAQRFLSGLHFIHFHHWVLRWLYFVLGLGSCGMIATGYLFWQESRRARQAGTFGFRLVEGLSAGSITGIIIATLAFFISNRLLPPGAHILGTERSALEVWCFYLVWLGTFLHGWFWPRGMWVSQSAAISMLAALAAVLNWLTTGDYPLHTLSHRYLWPVGGMDLVLLTGSALALLTAIRLARRKQNATTAPRQPAGKTA